MGGRTAERVSVGPGDDVAPPTARGAVRAGPPALPRTFLDRPLLRRALDDAAGCTVTEVIGPAGSGKTLGVAGWLQRVRAGDPADEGARAEARWWTVTSALTAAGLRALLRAPGRVVLDNAERLRPECVREFEALLDTARPDLRVVLVTRWDLPIRGLVPVLLGTLGVIRGDRVRLTDDEARRLAALHAPGCTPEELEAVVHHARGWAAAVVLAARAVTRPGHAVGGRPHAGLGDTALVGQEAFASLRPQEQHVLLAVCQEALVTGPAAVHLSQDPGALGVVQGLADTGLLVQRERTSGPRDHADDDAFGVHPILLQVARRRLAAGGPEVERALAAVAEAARVDLLRGDAGAGVRRTLDGAGPGAAARAVAGHGLAAILHGDGSVVDDVVRRCAVEVGDEPRAWLPAAVAAWFAGDLTTAALWSDRVVAGGERGGVDGPGPTSMALARLVRTQLGVEDPAVAPTPTPRTPPDGDGPTSTEHGLLSDLRGAASAWTGDLGRAEGELADAVVVARTHGYPLLLADALTRLACAELLRDRPTTATDLVDEALRTGTDGTSAAHAVADAAAARTDPWRHAAAEPAPSPPTGRDLVATYLGQVAAAQRLALRGSAREADRALTVLTAVPTLPRHLMVDLLVRRTLVAGAAEDDGVLREVALELDRLGAGGESALAAGFRAVLRSQPREAVAHLGRAAGTAERRGVALTATVTLGRLAAAQGDHVRARRLVTEALDRAEPRRDAVPFVGWLRQLVPVQVLLDDAGRGGAAASEWARRIARSARAHDRTTAAGDLPGGTGGRTAWRPTLTVREQEVLAHLARGATYGDVAAALHLSANTVKTHVSALYAKLGAARRSEALTIARTLDLV